MQINYVFKNDIPHPENLKNFISDKTEKYTRYFNGDFKSYWTFSSAQDNYSAHLRVVGNNIDFFAEDTAPNILTAVESCVDKVERQLKKHKEILKDHHR